MVKGKSVTVRLSADVHRQAKLRAVREGVSLQALVERWFAEYARGRKP